MAAREGLRVRTDLDNSMHQGGFVQSPLSQERPQSSSTGTSSGTSSLMTSAARYDESSLSTKLARIRELHEEIAGAHLKLETGDIKSWQQSLKSAQHSSTTSSSTASREQKKDNTSAYEHVAAQSTKRQEGIQSITAKVTSASVALEKELNRAPEQLDELSKVLRELHSMPPPVLFSQQSLSSKRLPATPISPEALRSSDGHASPASPERQRVTPTERRSSFG